MTAVFLLLATTMALVVSAFVPLTEAAVASPPQLPTGIVDLLAATPTMLSPLDLRNHASTTRRGSNTITIADSQIVFAQSDKATLVATITSMMENSEPSELGDQQLTNTILAVLAVDGSDQEAAVATQIQETLACRVKKETLRRCVTTLVEMAVPADQDGAEQEPSASADAVASTRAAKQTPTDEETN